MTQTRLYAVILIYVFLFAQNGYAQNPLEQEVEVFSNAVDAEKIYLQLSGNYL